MASFKYNLKNPKSTEETSIYLRYNDKGVNVKFYISQKIHPKKWHSEDEQARKTYQGYADFNSLLDGHKSHLKTLCTQLLAANGKIDIEILKEKFDESLGRNIQNGKKEFKSVTEYIDHYIKGLTDKKANTIKQYKQTLRLLKEFDTAKGRRTTFDKVDLDFHSDFVDFLTHTKKFSPNWIGKNIKNLKLYLGEAFERGLHTTLIYKSKKFKTYSEDVDAIYLSEAEIQKLYDYDFSKNKRLEHTRDLFIVGCWTGLRFSDFSQLKLENIVLSEGHECFKVRTQKTDKTVVIPVHHLVKKILQKYSDSTKGLPRTISNQKMNDYLKDVAKDAGLKDAIVSTKTRGGMKISVSNEKFELVTTHTARRSFATNLFLDGFPTISIMKITGHKTERAFMKYIKISQEQNAKLLHQHWNKNVKLNVA